jgi:hypothetical protein
VLIDCDWQSTSLSSVDWWIDTATQLLSILQTLIKFSDY